MKKRREGKYLGEDVEDRNEVGDRNWVLVGRGGSKTERWRRRTDGWGKLPQFLITWS